MTISRKSLLALVSGIALFFMLLNNSTIYSAYFDKLSNIFLIIGGAFTILASFISKKIFYFQSVKYLLFLLIIFSVPSLINGVTSSLVYYFLKFTVVLILLSVMKLNEINILKILYKVIKIFIIWSLLNYCLSYINFKLPVTNSYPTWWGGSYNLYLFVFFKNTQVNFTFFSLQITRLHSPFSEPGVAQLFFNYFILYNLFLNEKNERIWLLIAVMVILLSTSLIGYLILFIIFMAKLFSKRRYLISFIIAIPIIIVSFIMICQKLDSISFTDRYADLKFIFESCFNNLPFGIGIGNGQKINTKIDASGGGAAGFYSGLFTPIVYLGIFSCLFYYYLYLSIKYFTNNKYAKFAFCFLILLTLFSEPLSLTLIIAIFFINGILNKIVCHENNLEVY